jgi:hypothetical protein
MQLSQYEGLDLAIAGAEQLSVSSVRTLECLCVLLVRTARRGAGAGTGARAADSGGLSASGTVVSSSMLLGPLTGAPLCADAQSSAEVLASCRSFRTVKFGSAALREVFG